MCVAQREDFLDVANHYALAVYIDGCNNCIFSKNTMYELGYSCITGETTVPSPGTEFSTIQQCRVVSDRLQRTTTATTHAR